MWAAFLRVAPLFSHSLSLSSHGSSHDQPHALLHQRPQARPTEPSTSHHSSPLGDPDAREADAADRARAEIASQAAPTGHTTTPPSGGFSPEQIEALSAPLNRAHISSREQGRGQVAYLKSYVVINEANRIFGFDGWQRQTLFCRCVTQAERLDWAASRKPAGASPTSPACASPFPPGAEGPWCGRAQAQAMASTSIWAWPMNPPSRKLKPMPPNGPW